MNGEVKIRLTGDEKDVRKLRRHLLKSHPQMILCTEFQGSVVPSSKNYEKYFSFGNYIFGKIRRRKIT